MQGGNLSIPGKPSSARYSVPYMPGVLIFNEFSTKNWNFPSFLYAEKQLTYSQIISAIIVVYTKIPNKSKYLSNYSIVYTQRFQ
jgi:hypothetical protein